jgi:DNA-binding NarL/FixJ family response regulator
MKIFLLSNNQKYSSYWRQTVDNSFVISTDEISTITDEDILIMDTSSYLKNRDISAKIIILDNEPTFEQCMLHLKSGIKAYGNTYMHSIYILSAIESLKENKVWIYPDFIAKMITLSTSNSSKTIEEKIEPLSKREREIAKLILEGLTNKELAINLKISVNTIKIHITNIYKKLDVSDRLALFTYLNK